MIFSSVLWFLIYPNAPLGYEEKQSTSELITVGEGTASIPIGFGYK